MSMGPNSQSKDPRQAGVLNRETLAVIMQISKQRKWSSKEIKILMECYLLSEPKVRGYRKHKLSLCLNKGVLGTRKKYGNTMEMTREILFAKTVR